MNSKKILFLDLPPEVRNHIYVTYFHAVLGSSLYPCLVDENQFNRLTRIFLVNRQICHETRSLFFDQIFPKLEYDFDSVKRITCLIRIVPREHWKHIRAKLFLETTEYNGIGARIDGIMDLVAKEVGYEDSYDLEQDAYDVYDRERETNVKTIKFSPEWDMSLRWYRYLDMVMYEEWMELSGDFGRLSFLEGLTRLSNVWHGL